MIRHEWNPARISVLGFSDTGKTTFIEELVSRCRASGVRVAVLKYSRHPGDFDRPGSDTDRARAAGAALTAYRSDNHWYVTLHADADDAPVGAAYGTDGANPATPDGPVTDANEPDRDAGAPAHSANEPAPAPPPAEMPEWLMEAAGSADVIVAEGRLLPGSFVVLAAGTSTDLTQLKYPPQNAHLVIGSKDLAARLAVTNPGVPVHDTTGAVSYYLEMSGKKSAARGTEARKITLKVNGVEVSLNGFVMDVFQEVVTGLVRTLGDEDERAKIELVIEKGNTE